MGSNYGKNMQIPWKNPTGPTNQGMYELTKSGGKRNRLET